MDITKLAGYREDMTADEKLSLVEGYIPPETDESIRRKAEAFDKTSSDYAKLKKDYKELSEKNMTEEQRLIAENEDLKAQVAELTRERNVNAKKARFASAFGCDEETAGKLAESFFDGKDDFFDAMTTVIEAKVAKGVSDKLGSTLKPEVGNSTTGGMTKEKLMKMSYAERNNFYRDNPEEYEALTKNK